MLMALLVLGIALVAFGALVLLKYSDRPGGTIKWLGIEVSSKGAGLPLIALGVGCIAFAATRFPLAATGPGSITPSDSGLRLVATSANRVENSDTSCVAALLDGVPRDRVDTVEVGTRALEVIGPHQKLDAPFVLVLTEDGKRIGTLRLRMVLTGNASSDFFKVEATVDAGCATVREIRNQSRGEDPRVLVNWDTFRQTLGGHQYDLRIGGEQGVSVSFARVP